MSRLDGSRTAESWLPESRWEMSLVMLKRSVACAMAAAAIVVVMIVAAIVAPIDIAVVVVVVTVIQVRTLFMCDTR